MKYKLHSVQIDCSDLLEAAQLFSKQVLEARFTEPEAKANEEKLLGGYEYSVVYKLDPEKQCIYAAYSQEFKDALYSNAEDGVLQRN